MPKDTGLQPSCLPNSNKIAWSNFLQQNKYFFFYYYFFFLSKAGRQLLCCRNQAAAALPGSRVLNQTGQRCRSTRNLGNTQPHAGHRFPLQLLKAPSREGWELCSYFTGYSGTSDVLQANLVPWETSTQGHPSLPAAGSSQQKAPRFCLGNTHR